MPDKITPEARSRNMSAIRSTKTKLEDKVSKALWARGFRFRRNVKDLKGKPDIAIKKYKLVVFVDSCFWHNCDIHGHIPKSNSEYWIAKFENNKNRDAETNKFYQQAGWHVLRIWEHDLQNDFEKTIDGIAEFIICSQNFKLT